MANISLDVLDAYTKRLSDKQVGMLYEKTMHKKFEKTLNENVIRSSDYQLYLNVYTIAQELGAKKIDLLMEMHDNYADTLESVAYRVDSDAILFSTPDRAKYSRLLENLKEIGFSDNTLNEIADEKY